MDVIEDESNRLDMSSFQEFTLNHATYLDNIEKGLLLDQKMWKLVGKNFTTILQLAKTFYSRVDLGVDEITDLHAVCSPKPLLSSKR